MAPVRLLELLFGNAGQGQVKVVSLKYIRLLDNSNTEQIPCLYEFYLVVQRIILWVKIHALLSH